MDQPSTNPPLPKTATEREERLSREGERILRVENLVKYYQTFPAVRGISFQVRSGEIVALLGPNGAGKTTILRTICGVLQPTDGTIVVNGYDSVKNEIEVKKRVAYVPETPNPYDLLTVWEHLEFIARAYGSDRNFRERAVDLIERLQLREKQYDLVATLSKGMKQKLTLACAFVREASLYLLDEPLMGLDPRGQKEVKALVTESAERGAAILISTHILAIAEEWCHRVLILNKGQLVAEGGLDDLKARVSAGQDASLEEVFLALTEDQQSYGRPPLA